MYGYHWCCVVVSVVPFYKQLLLRNCAVDLIEICIVYVGKMIIKAAKRIFNSDKIKKSYSDLNFGITFLEHTVEHVILFCCSSLGCVLLARCYLT